MFCSPDNVLKLSPEKVYVKPVCVSGCVPMPACVCTNVWELSKFDWTKYYYRTSCKHSPTPPTHTPLPPPRFPKFSFPRLMTEKIKTSHATPKPDGRDDEEREKRLMGSFATSECNVEATVLFCNHNREKGKVPNHITKCCFSKKFRTRGGSEIMAPKNLGIFCKKGSFLYVSPKL